MKQRIIVNPEPLTLRYNPERLLYREKEKQKLLSNLQNFIPTFICGPPGSGKSTLVKFAVNFFNSSHSAYARYIDCSIYQTSYSVLKEIVPRSEFVLYRSNYELIKRLIKELRNKKFVVCLDNFEELKDKSLIAKLMSLGVCLVLVSNSEENFHLLSDNIRANIPSIMRISKYKNEEIVGILKDRAEKALAKWTYNDSILKKVAEMAKGNASMALNLLRMAASNAEIRERRSIEEQDIPELNTDCPAKLKFDEKILLEILKEWKRLPSGRLYSFYAQRARWPKHIRTFRNYMRDLCSKGLVVAYGDKKGRFYEVVEGDRLVSRQNSVQNPI